MGPFEAITAIFTFASELAKIRLAKLQALSGQALTAEVLAEDAAEAKVIEDVRAFGRKIYEDAAKVNGLFVNLGQKIKDVVAPAVAPAVKP